MFEQRSGLGKSPQLIILAVFFAVVIVGSVFYSEFGMLVQGAVKTLYGGTSFGKTLFVVGWFIANCLISIALLRVKIFERIPVKPKLILAIFIAIAAVGLYAGSIHFQEYVAEYGSAGPFMSYVDTAEHQGMEYSIFEHNHFPKTTLYWFSEKIGLQLPNNFDSGYPLLAVSPGSESWNLLYVAIILVLIILGLIFANNLVYETGIADYLLFLAAELGIIVLVLDGGMYSTYFIVSLFILLLFIERNFMKFENKIIAALFPLLGVSFYAFVFGNVSYEGFVYASGWSLVLFFGALVIVAHSIRVAGRRQFKATIGLVAIAAFLFCSSFGPLYASFLDSAYGEAVPAGENSGIYIYGVPESAADSEISEIASWFGNVSNMQRLGWVTYFKVLPNADFRLKYLENKLERKFQPQTYLVANYNYVVTRELAIKIKWLSGSMNKQLLSELEHAKIIDVMVQSLEFDDAENSATLYIDGETLPELQMLTVFTWLREQGVQEKIIMFRV